MPGNLHERVAKLTAQAGAQEEAYEREWWRRPGAVEEARLGAERKFAACLFTACAAQSSPEQVTASLAAAHPGYPDAYSEDERTQIILNELFHSNPDLKADIHRTLKAQMRGEGLMR